MCFFSDILAFIVVIVRLWGLFCVGSEGFILFILLGFEALVLRFIELFNRLEEERRSLTTLHEGC